MLPGLEPGLGLVLRSGLQCMAMAVRLFGSMVVEMVQLPPQIVELELTGMCLDELRGWRKG